MTLGELVRKAREDKGWDQTRLAVEAGYSQAAISDIEAGRTVAPRAWRKLAAALGVEEDIFRGVMIESSRKEFHADRHTTLDPTSGHGNFASWIESLSKFDPALQLKIKSGLLKDIQEIAAPLVAPNATITGPVDRPDPNSIPVHGRAKGGDDGKYEFNGDVIGWEPRPAKLRGISGVYAVYIDGESMYPRYKAGETVVAQPGRPIARGDDVIVQLAADEENEAPYGYVKEFVRWTPTKLVLSQFNPKQEIEFARDQVVSVHRIVHADR